MVVKIAIEGNKLICLFRDDTVRLVDATTACDMLKCSRQNLFYLVKEKKLRPIIQGKKENMYLKGEIIRLMNEKI